MQCSARGRAPGFLEVAARFETWSTSVYPNVAFLLSPAAPLAPFKLNKRADGARRHAAYHNGFMAITRVAARSPKSSTALVHAKRSVMPLT